uniref:C-type lectin domain-containing protein n=1 Tax=Cyprinodon variegatus TaxID=28743 RepID=A0A3Q2DZY2_CYPVA
LQKHHKERSDQLSHCVVWRLQRLRLEEGEKSGENSREDHRGSSCFGSNRFIDERLLKCEAGWEQHGGKCYYFSTNKSSWEESRRLCKGLGGDLVKIDSREEQMFIREKLVHMMKNDEDKFWIGLTDSEEEGRWLWVDGSPLNTRFVLNKKIISFKQADCVRMGQIGGSDVLKSWFDTSCDAHQKIICEKAEKTR